MNKDETMTNESVAKQQVRAFWEADACGERLYLGGERTREAFDRHEEIRYRLEPYIPPFADFEACRGKRVLEVGCGLGADHKKFAEAGADLCGIDLTEKAAVITTERLAAYGLASNVSVGDAESLDYPDDRFDLVWSWGVIHHSPQTDRAAQEILRVLKPGGEFKVMIYHRHAIVGWMLWFRYGLLRLRPFTSLTKIYAEHMESPGTKAYTVAQARELFRGAEEVQAQVELTHGDLLTSGAGQRHRGALLSIARKIWPRWFIRRFLKKRGLFLLIQGAKAVP